LADRRLASLVAAAIALASCAPQGGGRAYQPPDPASFELITGRMTFGDANEDIQGARVSAVFFTSTGGRAFLGRLFIDNDFVSPGRAVVIHHSLWQARFNGDPSVIGQRVQLNGEPHTVLGVAPPDFDIPDTVRFWLPRQEGE
jgi:hypothetical protein